MDKNKLISLLKRPEGPKLDYKLKISLNTNGEKRELCRDIAAIANTYGGRGYIIFGVEDKTKSIVGIEKEEGLEEKIQQIISNRIDPPVPIRIEFVEHKEKVLCILTIFKSYHRPHQIRQNGTFYIRRGSTTDMARRYDLALMFQESGIINWEMIPVYESKIDEIDEKMIYSYCKKINIKEEISLELLENIGICTKTEEGKYCLTLGGLLVFGKYPQKHILGSSIRIINELKEDTEIKVFQGNIIYMLDEVEHYLKHYIGYYNYPLEGIYECIRNSLVHRDYFDSNREIVVYLSPNKVEINNPGTLMMEDTLTSILKEKNPIRRNNWIYQRLLILDNENRFLGSGMGFNRIKKSFENIGNIKFLNIYKRNLFRVILPGIR